jgi:hypothetical protein
MRFLILTLSLAIGALTAPTPLQSTDFVAPDKSLWEGPRRITGLTIPEFCRKNPGALHCPGKLNSGNALLTAKNIMVTENKNSATLPNQLQVGWDSNYAGKTTEESTIALFDFPAGMEGKQCRFQFISDPAIDVVKFMPAGAFNVWKLGQPKVAWDQKITWDNKPQREVVLATFLTDKELVNDSMNGKWQHKFYYGPGYRTQRYSRVNTFDCPKAGKIAYEVASGIKMTGEEIEGSKIIVRGERAGLGIEIIGLKSQW